MRLLLVFLIIMAFTGTSSAQIQRRVTVTVVGKPDGDLPPAVRDTLIQRKRDMERNRLPYNGMPNAIITKPLPPVYVGNNGKGLDMFISPVDNTGIVKPDSSFGSNMPVERTGNANVMVIPGNKMNELLEWQKKRNSLFMPAPQYLPYLKKQSRPLF